MDIEIEINVLASGNVVTLFDIRTPTVDPTDTADCAVYGEHGAPW
jgi:hypothetical protein